MRLSDDSAGAEIRVVCGPTAAGKSAIAMWLAERQASVIVSADSRQVYRGFDIGTAKPSAAERARVPHRGIDVADPTDRYSAAAWADAADGWIEAAHVDTRRPLVVGGTGLYLRALFDRLFEEPPLDGARRDALQAQLGLLDTSELRRWVQSLDPARAHLGRTQLLRAVEIALLSGHRVSELHHDRARKPRWRPRYLVVDPGIALAQRISRRLDEMLNHGWPEEVQRLMQIVPPDAPAWNATGYDTVRRMMRGQISAAAAREAILVSTRQYAKRQRTWFRHQLPGALVTRIDPTSPDWPETLERWAIGPARGEAIA
jgi:tRNA dimethylallyltransferase